MFKVAILLCCLICISQGSEPKCSKFAYDEAVLEKMVRMEFKVEQMHKGMKAIETKVLDQLANFREERENMKSTFKAEFEDLKAKYDNLDGVVIKEKLAIVEDNLSKLSLALSMLQEKNVQQNQGHEKVMFMAKDVPLSNPGVGQRMVFSTVTEEKGRGYDTKTGIFTASVAGIYLFTVQFCGYPDKEFTFAFMRDGKSMLPVMLNNAKYSCVTSTYLATMDKGSRVWVQCTYTRSGNVFYSNSYRWNVFSGVLIHPIES